LFFSIFSYLGVLQRQPRDQLIAIDQVQKPSTLVTLCALHTTADYDLDPSSWPPIPGNRQLRHKPALGVEDEACAIALAASPIAAGALFGLNLQINSIIHTTQVSK
jgi:hypothetical protein